MAIKITASRNIKMLMRLIPCIMRRLNDDELSAPDCFFQKSTYDRNLSNITKQMYYLNARKQDLVYVVGEK